MTRIMQKNRTSVEGLIEKMIVKKQVLGVIVVFIIMNIAYAAFKMPSDELKDTLQNSAQLSITMALGISALIFALNVNKNGNEKSLDLMKTMIIFILISILSFYISFNEYTLLLRIYVLLSGLVQVAIVIQVYSVLFGKGKNEKQII